MRVNGKYKQCLEHRRTQEALFSSPSLPAHKHLCTHTRERRLVEQAGLCPASVVSSSPILGTLSLALGAEVKLYPGKNQVFGFPGVCIRFSGSKPYSPAALHPSTLLGPCASVQSDISKFPACNCSRLALNQLHHLSIGVKEQATIARKGLGWDKAVCCSLSP